jgi:mono/diheme cytochrome c family protein
MNPMGLARLAFAVAATVFAAGSQAQERTEFADAGMLDFKANCAGCHGAGGRGDGAYEQFNKLRIPDLTMLSARNHGVFPTERVTEIIDGRQIVIIHGTPGMPVWGNRFSLKAAAECREARCDSESVVRARIQALIAYIRQLDAKANAK